MKHCSSFRDIASRRRDMVWWWWRHVLVSVAFIIAFALVCCGGFAYLYTGTCVQRPLRWAKRLWRRGSDPSHTDYTLAVSQTNKRVSEEPGVEMVRVTSDAPPVDSLAAALRDYEPGLHDLVPAYAPPCSSSYYTGPSTSVSGFPRPPPHRITRAPSPPHRWTRTWMPRTSPCRRSWVPAASAACGRAGGAGAWWRSR